MTKAVSKQVKEVQKKIEVLMTDKEIHFEAGSWDVDFKPENKPILEGLASILKENPTMAINIHGVQYGKNTHPPNVLTQDAVSKKTFAECFPKEPNPYATGLTDGTARARATASMHALRDMGCVNAMSVTSECGGERKIVFSVKH